MGRTRLWDIQFKINWLSAWVERLKAVAVLSGEDVSSIARKALEREVKKREKNLGIQPVDHE